MKTRYVYVMTPPSDSTLTGGTLSLGKKNIIPTRAELGVRQDLSLPNNNTLSGRRRLRASYMLL